MTPAHLPTIALTPCAFAPACETCHGSPGTSTTSELVIDNVDAELRHRLEELARRYGHTIPALLAW